jgi:hypothetical protein
MHVLELNLENERTIFIYKLGIYYKLLKRRNLNTLKIVFLNFSSSLATQKEELSEPSHTPNRLGQKGRWATTLALFSSRIRSTFVGYPLHSYQLVTPLKNIKQCDYNVKSQPLSC